MLRTEGKNVFRQNRLDAFGFLPFIYFSPLAAIKNKKHNENTEFEGVLN